MENVSFDEKLGRKDSNEMMDSINNKSHIFYKTHNIYSRLYENIRDANTQNAKEKLSSVLMDFMKNGKKYAQSFGKEEQRIISDTKELQQEWNSVMDAMGTRFQHLKFKTSLNNLV
ncbi:hypothetical protein BD780_000882 [Clostridium tetanomorphum]|uniref:Uncharacterized protein n=1 Tax=Clostridium tetanomorphum TaxID=1553 RepID=A0A923J1G9_CLOTT|nr:hypothetical protein [Clostridium tetanomorphum]MBC2398784.1 hypothetical protein [Clostridium tetanomorphum]MBP1863557.1 hypothetical protein [Clostridium tetanomorphum]NRS83657.1 hypothetical protein [Clostridium tetanomorphum]NRZ96850.1 hypothetical protein [Clostridium tetanomorphum]SQC02065.1 Uncharacterised protein [Clostridium tetanomorphum]